MNDITRTQFLQPILEAMQRAEEMGGPEGEEYLYLMSAVRMEATKRWSAASANFPLLPGDLTDEEYRKQADSEYGSDDVEIDSDAIVSRDGEPDQRGAFVQAWVWVAHDRRLAEGLSLGQIVRYTGAYPGPAKNALGIVEMHGVRCIDPATLAELERTNTSPLCYWDNIDSITTEEPGEE